jgi:transcriptional regulator with XRE-family HTH domain
MDNTDNIGSRLDLAMIEAGVESQAALARASGVPQPTINRILKGSSKGPEAATVRKLAQALNVPFDWLNEGIGGKGRQPHTPSGESLELAYTSARERRLLTNYRLSDERGREAIEEAAEATEKRSLATGVRQA